MSSTFILLILSKFTFLDLKLCRIQVYFVGNKLYEISMYFIVIKMLTTWTRDYKVCVF